MKIEDIKVSDLQKAINNPDALKAIRAMNPDFAKMSDEDFAKVVSMTAGRLEQFADKFGNMTGGEVLDMNNQESIVNPPKNNEVSNMTLDKALMALKPLKNYDKLTIQEKLNSGCTLVCADKKGTQTAIKYVWKVKGNLLYSYKLSDSTPTHIVLTLEQINKMIPGLFDLLYDDYISKQDLLFEDVEDNFGNVDENNWNMSDTEIEKMMSEKDVIGFNDGWNK